MSKHSNGSRIGTGGRLLCSLFGFSRPFPDIVSPLLRRTGPLCAARSCQHAAELLETSVAAVNSAVNRARVSMKGYQAERRSSETPPIDTQQTAALLARYVNAWQAADADGLVALLREDALITMPPLPLWYQGRAAIRWFFETQLFTGEARGSFRLVATRANGSPAFATYQRDDAGPYRLGALQVLTIEDNRIAEIHDFLAIGSTQFPGFDLPISL